MRTFVPPVAGVSYMRYPVFLGFDIVGGILWGGGVTLAGYFMGNVPFVHHNLQKILLAILLVSLMPAFIAAWRSYRRRRREQHTDERESERLPAAE